MKENAQAAGHLQESKKITDNNCTSMESMTSSTQSDPSNPRFKVPKTWLCLPVSINPWVCQSTQLWSAPGPDQSAETHRGPGKFKFSPP